MSKSSLHVLSWSEERQHYELHTQSHLQQCFRPDDEQMWQEWLSTHTTFAFQGQQGHMSVVKEARSRGAGYWYGYSTRHRHTSKHYLGTTVKVTLTRLEEEVKKESQKGATSPQIEGAPIADLGRPATAFATTLSQASLPILASKLSPPRLPTMLVEREYLLVRLDAALTHPLTLLSASAGWGKSTLLSAWVARSPYYIAWLSLDEMDNDPTRFWSSVIAALRSQLPDIGASAYAMLQSTQPPRLATILTTLLNELSDPGQKIVLILDDYHLIEEPSIHESLLYFLDHLPAHLHLVLSSRVDPPLPLARLRVRGQMSELRTIDLRFQEEDAAHFLIQGMGLPLSEEEVLVLESRTEGWIAGLQLAALALQQREDRAAFVQAFGGSHRYLLDYVQEDILARQPVALQTFMLQTAILSRLNAALCQTVTEEAGSQERLEMIERANLFLIPLDDERRWYRFHALFRETLFARLKATQPDLVPILHQRAAHWYETQGALREAIVHTLAAEDFSAAAALIERAAEEAWRVGDAQTVHSWIKALPDHVLREHLDLALSAALHLLHRIFGASEEKQAEAVEQTIARVEHLLWNNDKNIIPKAEEVKSGKRIRLFYLWSTASKAILAGDMEQLRLHGQQMQPLALEDGVIWQMGPLFINVIFCMNSLADVRSLMPMLLKAQRQSEMEHRRYEFLRTGQWLAQVYWELGQLHQAHNECLKMLHLLEQEDKQASSIGGYLHLTLARIFWTWNRREEALTHLQTALQQAQTWQYIALLVEAYTAWMRLLLDEGDLAGAEQAQQEVERLTRENGIALSVPNIISARVGLWLAQGNLAAAGEWATHYKLNLEALEFTSAWEEHLALADVYCAQRQYAQALPVLTHLLDSAERGKRGGKIAHILALQIIALEVLGEREQARQIAIRLLRLTEAEGMLRVYLDAGQPMRQVLQSFHNEPYNEEAALPKVSLAHVSTLLEIFEQEEHKKALGAETALTGTEKARPLPPQNTSSAHAGRYEPLSPQEQRVLHLLVVGRTYAEMAQELIVSLNTIKTQVSSIYRKLDVSRRAEASAVAQRLHLL